MSLSTLQLLATHKQTQIHPPLSLCADKHSWPVSRPDFGPQQNYSLLWLRPDSHLYEHLKTKKHRPHCAPEPSPSIMFHLWAWLDQSGAWRLPSLRLIDPLSPSFIPFACLWHMCQRQHSSLMDRPVYGCQSPGRLLILQSAPVYLLFTQASAIHPRSERHLTPIERSMSGPDYWKLEF